MKPVVAAPVAVLAESAKAATPVVAKVETKKSKKIDEEFVPEIVSTKQALKSVLSELETEDDGDNLIDSFIGSAKG